MSDVVCVVCGGSCVHCGLCFAIVNFGCGMCDCVRAMCGVWCVVCTACEIYGVCKWLFGLQCNGWPVPVMWGGVLSGCGVWCVACGLLCVSCVYCLMSGVVCCMWYVVYAVHVGFVVCSVCNAKWLLCLCIVGVVCYVWFVMCCVVYTVLCATNVACYWLVCVAECVTPNVLLVV